MSYLDLPPVLCCLQVDEWWGEDEWCEAGCWSRWHLWPSTTAVDAGHMLLPQRLLAPFLPHWAHAHVQWPQTHTHTHTWNTSSEWIYCTEGYLETTVIQHAFRTCCKIISSHLVFFVYYSDFFSLFFSFILDCWPTLCELLTATQWTGQTAKHEDHRLTENNLLIWIAKSW